MVLINVPQGIRFLVTCFAEGTTREERELHEALSALHSVADWNERLDHVSAHVLLAGFALLADRSDEPRKVRKLSLMRDHLRLYLAEGGEPSPQIHPSAVVALWADIVSLTAWAAVRCADERQRQRWFTSAQAWAQGLAQLIWTSRLHRGGRPARSSGTECAQ